MTGITIPAPDAIATKPSPATPSRCSDAPAPAKRRAVSTTMSTTTRTAQPTVVSQRPSGLRRNSRVVPKPRMTNSIADAQPCVHSVQPGPTTPAMSRANGDDTMPRRPKSSIIPIRLLIAAQQARMAAAIAVPPAGGRFARRGGGKPNAGYGLLAYRVPG